MCRFLPRITRIIKDYTDKIILIYQISGSTKWECHKIQIPVPGYFCGSPLVGGVMCLNRLNKSLSEVRIRVVSLDRDF